MAGNITIKVAGLTRDEVRAMDKAAKAADRTRSHWARLTLVRASQDAPAGKLQALAPKLGPHDRCPDCLSYDQHKPTCPRIVRFPLPKPCTLCGGVGAHAPACPDGTATPLTYEKGE